MNTSLNITELTDSITTEWNNGRVVFRFKENGMPAAIHFVPHPQKKGEYVIVYYYNNFNEGILRFSGLIPTKNDAIKALEIFNKAA